MDHPNIEVRTIPGVGKGVFIREKISAGEEVAAFDGAIYEWKHPHLPHPDDPPETIALRAIPFHPLKSKDSDGVANLCNHSCDPNCGIKDRFRIVAMRDLEPGEEATWDYDMAQDCETWHMVCRCGAANCREIVAGYRFLPLDRRRAYKGFISEWLLEGERPYLGPAKELAKMTELTLNQERGNTA